MTSDDVAREPYLAERFVDSARAHLMLSNNYRKNLLDVCHATNILGACLGLMQAEAVFMALLRDIKRGTR